MIEIVGITKSYGDKRAVDNLTLDVRDGEIFGFIGPNGAGKTTTIKTIVGMLRPDSGAVRVNGVDVQANPIEAKLGIAYVPDTPDVYERLTGIQFVNFIADAYRVPQDVRVPRIAQLAEMLEMTDALGDVIESYSHGMRQKIVLIAALVHDPKAWVLDEPLVGLDPKASFALKGLMRQHADSGNTVFFSTHILEVAERLCDRVGVIVQGRLVACGTLDELRTSADSTLESIFLDLVDR
ncbi:MAG: ABC transporter ATP-binding protein [Chthonomonadales bacterium]|nr:ABC transporter ATP-binding protein [Chthonomonadales bacterium]